MNKYEIIGIVGEGAYGIVYKAKNKDTGQFGKFFIFDIKQKHRFKHFNVIFDLKRFSDKFLRFWQKIIYYLSNLFCHLSIF